MIRKVVTIAGIMTLAVSPILADFSYQEKSTITGGAMAAMLKVAGVFSKQAREPIQTSISVKGDRMVTRSANHSTIIDLNSQTITSVDLQKRTWTVMTFEEMKQMLEQTQQRMQNAKKEWRCSPDELQGFGERYRQRQTGEQVRCAREMILKMEMEGTDQQSGQKGSLIITTDMWITPAVKGYGGSAVAVPPADGGKTGTGRQRRKLAGGAPAWEQAWPKSTKKSPSSTASR